MISVELSRLAGAAGVLAAYTALCLRVWTVNRRQANAPAQALPQDTRTRSDAVLIAYATQTGFAHELADEASAAFAAAGVSSRVVALGTLDAADLSACNQALFIVSTCREGDAPDNAASFVARVMNAVPTLTSLRYGLLALGDRSYTDYCAFGRQLDGWLGDRGATPLFPRVELDGADSVALETWRHRLAAFAGVAELPEALAPALGYWRLRARRHLNPGSAGQPAYHVELEAVDGPEPDAPAATLPHWEAGDLLQILPPDTGAQPRAYSIASLPDDGAVHLLVRAIKGPDGTPGRMSALLTTDAPPGTVFRARVRTHVNFRMGSNASRPLILIGTGTGLAGLLAHLRQRARRGDGRNWLIFGERNAAQDDFHGGEINALERANLLARCDRVYSRDPAGEYIQQRLERAAETLREWVSGGAAIYVCGNAVGMGPAVHEVLTDALGAETMTQLARTGRYRRDIY